MEWQSWINAGIGLVAFMGGYILKSITDSVKELQVADKVLSKDVSSLQVLVAGEYVKWDGLEKVMRPVSEQLTRIEGKLDNKQDKIDCKVNHQ